jgi:hypothetical protein
MTYADAAVLVDDRRNQFIAPCLGKDGEAATIATATHVIPSRMAASLSRQIPAL